MTPKRAAFVREYLVDLNATEAAKRAGFSVKTAYSAGGRLLKDVEIQSAISAAQAKRAEKLDLSAEWVLAQLKKNYERAMQEEEVKDREGNGLGVFNYKGEVANRALELIGKHLGMFAEKSESTLTGSIKLIVERVDEWSMGDSEIVTPNRN